MIPWRIIGLLSGLAGLGAAELVTIGTGSDSSPLFAVGDAIVDLTPRPVKDVAIAVLGPADKFVLISGIIVVVAYAAITIGKQAARSVRYAVLGIAALGVVAAVAAVTRPDTSAWAVTPSVVGSVVAVVALLSLRRVAMSMTPTIHESGVATDAAGGLRSGSTTTVGGVGRADSRDGETVGRTGTDHRHDEESAEDVHGERADATATESADASAEDAQEQPGEEKSPADRGSDLHDHDDSDPTSSELGDRFAGTPDETAATRAGEKPPSDNTGRAAAGPTDATVRGSRRKFLVAGAAIGAFGVGAAVLGRWLAYQRSGAEQSRAALSVPKPASPARTQPRDPGTDIDGLSRFLTPNREFYRVDTALTVPQVAAEDWTLRIHGMVERPLTLTYRELVNRPLIERDVTLACVSNPVGGPYVGNARWIGVPVRELLDEVGVDPRADQVVSRSHDGMTIGTPTAALTDGRDAMLAVAMNGELLPLQHGFPVRMVVPGLYGYVSACKWIVEMELTTFAQYDAYWIKQGWAQQASVKTASRIDTPRNGDKRKPGIITVAGVAWAQHRGIERVEVQIGDGEWRVAELAEPGTIDTWRQWLYRWRAEPGTYTLRVRATDRNGEQQPGVAQDPFPDGATGYHAIEVTVGD